MGDPVTITKRLHIGGLTPLITPQHIKERFSIFGSVTQVEDLQPDALGQPRPFTFLTITTTQPQLNKCLNIMSGSHWRGAQLRLAEAKLKYDSTTSVSKLATTETETEMEMEKKEVVTSTKRKIPYQALADGCGKEAQDMRLVTPTIAKKKKFWSVVNELEQEDDDKETKESVRLVRPIAMRPSHPIGIKFVIPPSHTKKKINNQVNEKSKKKGIDDDKQRLRLPPKRAWNKVIDPLAYGSTYLSSNDFTSDDLEMEIGIEEQGWEYEDLEIEEDDQGGRIVGVWRRVVNGEIVEEQFVRAKRPRLSEELEDEDQQTGQESDDDFDLDDTRQRSVSPLFASRTTQDREPSPLFPSRKDVELGENLSNNSSPLFPTRSLDSAQEEPEAKSRSASPLFPTRAFANDATSPQSVRSDSALLPTQPNVDNVETESSSISSTSSSVLQENIPSLLPAPGQSSLVPVVSTTKSSLPLPSVTIPAPIRQMVKAERNAALNVLSSILGSSNEDKLLTSETKPGKSEWAGYDESDDDDDLEITRMIQNGQDDHMDEPLRLRGGAAPSSDDEEDDSEESKSDDEDSESESEPTTSSESDSDSSESPSSSSSSDSESSESTTSDFESDSDSSDSDESDEIESKAISKASTSAPKSTLKDMFAPSTAVATEKSGFSLLANLDVDLDIDEEMDIPLPVPASDAIPSTRKRPEVEQPLELELLSSGRNKVKFDPNSEIPLFFPVPIITLPSGSGAAESSIPQQRKGDAPNPLIELYVAPTPTLPEVEEPQNYSYGQGGYRRPYGQNPNQVESTKPLRGFHRQSNETDETMRGVWEKERLDLTQGWKKRFREAKKSRKRRGGVGDDID